MTSNYAAGSPVNAVEIWTLVAVLVLAVVTIYLAVLTRLSVRRVEERATALAEAETDRARTEREAQSSAVWERDQVTARYQELLTEVDAFQATYAGKVEPVLAKTPVPNLDNAWSDLSRAHSKMVQACLSTLIVARKRVHPIANALLHINSSVLVPTVGPNGMPPIARRRLDVERDHLAALHDLLLQAIRADMNLLEPALEGMLVMRMKSMGLVPPAEPPDRSFAAGQNSAGLRRMLADYDVRPVTGASEDFLMPMDRMNHYQSLHSGLGGNVHGLVITNGYAIGLGIREDLPSDRVHSVLERAARSVEGGLLDEYRDFPGGDRVIAYWERDESRPVEL